MSRLGEVLRVFARLGWTCFGGPIVHLVQFREEFVLRRKWLSEAAYADLVALCQFLPGPATSQVGMAVGHLRAGLPGALTAWAAFTLPSALLMTLFALAPAALPLGGGAWLHGLKVAAVAIVAQAVYSMAQSLAPDFQRRLMAGAVAGVSLMLPGVASQLLLMGACALAGWSTLRGEPLRSQGFKTREKGSTAALWLGAYFALLLLLPLAALAWAPLALFDAFYRAGALVFGGGHVVLPLLQNEVVSRGWMDPGTFMAGYGAAQALPGPLFSFAAYLGAAGTQAPHGWLGALIATLGIFLPSLLLVLGVLPFWERLKRQQGLRGALMGVNAGVVGLLLAALWNPVASSALLGPLDALVALGAGAALLRFQLPSWAILAACALFYLLLNALPFPSV